MYSNAKAYSACNKPQYDMGCDFVRALNISRGDKVLDMGCGTGEVTKFIADMVGCDGEVVGVDPDEARIKVAQEKFRDVQNVQFCVGDSITEFPHSNEEYYDLHFSNSVFHWVKGNNKKVYLEKAYQCLKPGGCIAIQTGVILDVKSDLKASLSMERLTEAKYKELFQEVDLFTDVVSDTDGTGYLEHFASYEEFRVWFKATYYRNLEEMGAEFVKNFLEKFTKTEADGRFTSESREFIRMTGRKQASDKQS